MKLWPAFGLVRPGALRSAVLSLALALSACSDPQLLSGGVGSGGSGLAEGFVTGFGSIIVDGVAYDDSAATEQADARDARTAAPALAIGQKVRLSLDDQGRVARIELQPQLRGPVTLAPRPVDPGQPFEVLGQPVRLIAQATQGFAPTLIEGFDSLNPLVTGTPVEVHGQWVVESGSGAVLYASRVERLDSLPAYYRLGGLVESLTAQEVVLNSRNAILFQVTDAASRLEPGLEIKAWLRREDWDAATGAIPRRALTASALEAAAPDPQQFSELKLSAALAASQIQNGSERLRVGGLEVRLPAELRGRLSSEPQLHLLRVTRDAQGELVVAELSTGSAAAEAAASEIRLKAVVRWPQQLPDRFAVRGTPVQGFVAAVANSPSCSGFRGGEEVFVDVGATRGGPGELPSAASVVCTSTAPEQAVRTQSGAVVGIERAANGAPIALLWQPEGASEPRRIEPPAGVGLDLAAFESRLNQRIEVDFQNRDGIPVIRRLREPR
jgi:hypothetical protein